MLAAARAAYTCVHMHFMLCASRPVPACLFVSTCVCVRAHFCVQVEVTIDNRYNTYSFDGAKSIVLANTSWLGGRNIFLGTGRLRCMLWCLVHSAACCRMAALRAAPSPPASPALVLLLLFDLSVTVGIASFSRQQGRKGCKEGSVPPGVQPTLPPSPPPSAPGGTRASVPPSAAALPLPRHPR